MPPIPVTETGRQIKALTKLRKARIASYSQITVPQIIRLEKGFRVILKLSRFIFNSTGLFFFIQHGEYLGEDIALLELLHRRISKIVWTSYDS